MEKKTLDQIETLLIVVDMIKGFTTIGNLHDNYITSVIPEQIEWIKFVRDRNGGQIAFMIDSHTKNSTELKPGGFLEHCLENTEECEVVEELQPYLSNSLIYYKNSTSGMFAKGFMSDIEKMKSLKKVILVGCCSDICIPNLAIPLKCYFNEMDLDIEVIIPIGTTETFQINIVEDGTEKIIHDRKQYTDAANLLMEQAGIQFVKKLERRK